MSIQEVPQISELALFTALPEESQRFLQDRMRRVDYPAGAMIVRAGMRCDYMAIVASGALELRSVSGEAQLIDTGRHFWPGDDALCCAERLLRPYGCAHHIVGDRAL